MCSSDLTKDLNERTRLIAYLREQGVYAVFHYVPLHTSIAGRRYGEFVGKDQNTTRESERLVRLPMFYGITQKQVQRVTELINSFYGREKHR